MIGLKSVELWKFGCMCIVIMWVCEDCITCTVFGRLAVRIRNKVCRIILMVSD